MSAIFIVSIILPILVLFAPWKAAWRIFWLFIFTFLTSLQFFPQNNDTGNGIAYLFGLLIVAVYFLFLGLIFFARWLMNNRNNFQTKEKKKKSKIDVILMFYCGVLTSVFVLKIIAFSFSGFAHGYILHLGIGLLSFVTAFVVFKFNKDFAHVSVFLYGLCCSIFLLSFLGMGYPSVVMTSALEIAGNNPYCMALGKRHRMVNDMEDLTFFTMDKSRAYHVALLVKKDGKLEPYHWSYTETAFQNGLADWDQRHSAIISCNYNKEFIDE